MLSAPLHDQLQVVAVVRRRVFVAGALAIAFAVLLRLRRRQPVRAPDPPAGGRGRADRGRRFDEPVVDHGSDELGQLARTFERMRLRLANSTAPGRVHRQCLARAADAALLAGRLPRAARRPGARRGDAGRVPRADARAGRPPDEARDRPARPLAPRRGPADGRARAVELSSSPRARRRSSGPRATAAGHRLDGAAEAGVAGARRRRARPPDRAGARGERARAHAAPARSCGSRRRSTAGARP